MKKLSLLLAAIMLLLCLCACGGTDKLPIIEDNTDDAVLNEAEAKEPPARETVAGTYSGDVYENGYMSYKFTKPSDWEYSSEEDIAELFDGAGLDDSSFCDMMVIDSATGNNINIIYTLTDESDIDDYLDRSEEEIKQLGDSLGMTSEFSAHEKVKLGSVDCTRLEITSDYQGIAMYQACYAAYLDGVLMNITVTINDGTPIADFEAMFE